MGYSGEKKRQYDRERLAAKRLEAIAYLGGRCVVCGLADELEFHHRDPLEKTSDVSILLGCQWSRLRVELDKCELRCAEHHKVEHAAAHGNSAYRHKGCRCDICVSAKREYNREYMRAWRAAGKVASQQKRK